MADDDDCVLCLPAAFHNMSNLLSSIMRQVLQCKARPMRQIHQHRVIISVSACNRTENAVNLNLEMDL